MQDILAQRSGDRRFFRSVPADGPCLINQGVVKCMIGCHETTALCGILQKVMGDSSRRRARAGALTLATRNVKDFSEIEG